MNLLEGNNLGEFMKGLTNAAVRSHGHAAPFPEVSPEMSQIAASALEQGEAAVAGDPLLSTLPPLDICPDKG